MSWHPSGWLLQAGQRYEVPVLLTEGQAAAPAIYRGTSNLPLDQPQKKLECCLSTDFTLIRKGWTSLTPPSTLLQWTRRCSPETVNRTPLHLASAVPHAHVQAHETQPPTPTGRELMPPMILTWYREEAVQVGGLGQAVGEPQWQVQSQCQRSHAAAAADSCSTLFLTHSRPRPLSFSLPLSLPSTSPLPSTPPPSPPSSLTRLLSLLYGPHKRGRWPMPIKSFLRIALR